MSGEGMNEVSVYVVELREQGREDEMDGLEGVGKSVCFTGMMVSVAGNLFMKPSTFLRFLCWPPEDGEWEVECRDDLRETSGIHIGVLSVAP